MRLREYLEKNGITQGDFAQKIGLAQPSVSKLTLGRSLPSLEVAYRVFVATGGAVTFPDWFSPPPAEADLPAPPTSER